jgi:hypothetical protein
MEAMRSATGYGRLAPWQARGVLAGLVLWIGISLAASPTPPPSVPRAEKASAGDIALYAAEIQRIHAGEGYYAAAAKELPARNYPTRSVFNWRTPLPMWLIGKLPAIRLGKLLLLALGVAMLLVAFEAAAREGKSVYRRAMPLCILMVAAFLPCIVGQIFVMPVAWAGTLIAISVCCYGVNRPWLGVAAGLAAVFFLDLALPYCLLAAGLALVRGRRGELAGWLIGLAAWAVFFGIHCWQVSQFIGPDARAHHDGWIQFGGTAFVLATVQSNLILLLLPTWITVLYFAAAMLGLAGWQTPLGLRMGLTVCLYVVAFSVVGHDFNRYWGVLTGPLFCFGVVRAPESLVVLWRAAFPRRRESLAAA